MIEWGNIKSVRSVDIAKHVVIVKSLDVEEKKEGKYPSIFKDKILCECRSGGGDPKHKARHYPPTKSA